MSRSEAKRTLARIEKLLENCDKKFNQMGKIPKHTVKNEKILQDITTLLDSIPKSTASAFVKYYRHKSTL